MAEDEVVHLDISGGIATITLDSPRNRNALSRQLTSELADHLETALGDPAARAVVLTHTGTVFCAGADLKESREANIAKAEGREQAPRRAGKGLPDMINMIWESPKPVIARVNGAVRAGGLGLMSACDFVVMVEEATMAFSEVRIGVVPAVISVVCLPRFSTLKGAELMLTGDTFTAAQAAAWGFINRAVPADQLDDGVGAIVDSLKQCSPNALAETKKMARLVPTLPTDEGFRQMGELSARMFASPEAREGMTAFAEKRDPSWAIES
ncbi:MAG: enoyl-CoA hydratase [Gammaproteobacteria bacterium]|nr:enoyl-CoA hydratase [Gammaproteobacteria bacterium]MBS04611.1 enoyl-CoA hydratase [Gammaproteobacteria bacterium]|tara:strand:- start:1575 stop:2378 length:804 start_codon:yes stop_codon:yes gene_type:complete